MEPVDFSELSCPVPISNYSKILMGHGGGGKLSQELIDQIFMPAFRNDTLATLSDSAVVNFAGGRLAFSTDSYVVQPLFFPGGCIGDLAVHGTINDLAMSGAMPLYLSAGFIIEEGFEISELQKIVDAMGQASRKAGVAIITGDTKVVERGHGDGVYINTAGVGRVTDGAHLAPGNAKPGDVILASGTMGDHGMAVMSVREGLEFDAPIQSDTAALHHMVSKMLGVSTNIRVMRDPTRGGLAASLNEIAKSSRVGMVLNESAIPVNPTVQSACEILGLDPMLVANEGKLIAIVPATDADAILAIMQSDPLGHAACKIGTVVADHPGMVVARTMIGATRVVTIPIGEQLPRIC